MRQYLSRHKGVFVIAGGSPWQCASVDRETGLREYGCGPSRDAHAGGFSECDRADELKFLLVAARFLAATVNRIAGEPRLEISHDSVQGEVTCREIISLD